MESALRNDSGRPSVSDDQFRPGRAVVGVITRSGKTASPLSGRQVVRNAPDCNQGPRFWSCRLCRRRRLRRRSPTVISHLLSPAD